MNLPAHHGVVVRLGLSALDAAAERARERIYDVERLYAYLGLFAPGVGDAPRLYRPRLMLETARGWSSSPGDPVQAIASSLVQGAVGATGRAQDGLSGCAVRLFGHELTQTVRLDIDRGYPQAIVDALAARYGHEALLVTRSRTPGRYHVVMRLRRPLAVRTAHGRLKHLIASLVRSDERVEAFPAPNRGLRLPFGLYGCEAATSSEDITRTTRQHPWTLLERAQRLKTIELPKAPIRKRRQRMSERRKRRSFEAADRMVRAGLDAGERDKGERSIIMAMHGRGVPKAEAVSRMRRLIYTGLIDRTRVVHECHGDVERARDRRAADMPRRVGDYYGRYMQRLPRPVHLSAHDVLQLTEHTRKQAALTGIPARDLRVFMYRVLSVFKAAALAGLPVLQWHHSHWQAAATHSRYGYNVLREACGVFHTDRSYLSLKRARRPDDAHAMRWRCEWQFDAAVPRRPLHTGRKAMTWAVNMAVGAARRQVARGYSVQALVSQPPKPVDKATQQALQAVELARRRGRGASARNVQTSQVSDGQQLALSASMVGISTKPEQGFRSVMLAGGQLGSIAALTLSAELLPPDDDGFQGRDGPTNLPNPPPSPIQPFPLTASRLESATREQLLAWLSVGLGEESENLILQEVARRKIERVALSRRAQTAVTSETDGPRANE